MSLKSDAADVQFTVNTPGYKLILDMLQEEFKNTEKKLRTAPGRTIFKIRGKLDGLEYAIGLPELLINRGELE